MGYHRAGFEVIGVDHKPQARYPFEFIQAEALEFMRALLFNPYCFYQPNENGVVCWKLEHFDVIHASPPCQRYSTATSDRTKHPDLYSATRELLQATGRPWVIENVIGAPYQYGVVLCGSMFGLRLRRHRNFETSHFIFQTACDHSGPRPYTITGNAGKNGYDRPHSLRCSASDGPAVMGMPWATWKEVTQAIPPAYTEWIGRQLLRRIVEADKACSTSPR